MARVAPHGDAHQSQCIRHQNQSIEHQRHYMTHTKPNTRDTNTCTFDTKNNARDTRNLHAGHETPKTRDTKTNRADTLSSRRTANQVLIRQQSLSRVCAVEGILYREHILQYGEYALQKASCIENTFYRP